MEDEREFEMSLVIAPNRESLIELLKKVKEIIKDH